MTRKQGAAGKDRGGAVVVLRLRPRWKRVLRWPWVVYTNWRLLQRASLKARLRGAVDLANLTARRWP